MVQNFSVFMDRSAAAKIRTTKFRSLASANYGLLMGVVPPEHQCKIKNHEIFFKGSGGGSSAKFCAPYENFSLYGIQLLVFKECQTATKYK